MTVKNTMLVAAALLVAGSLAVAQGKTSTSSSSHSSSSSSSSRSSNSSSMSNRDGASSSMRDGMTNGMRSAKPTHVITFMKVSDSDSSSNRDQSVITAHDQHIQKETSKGKIIIYGQWRDLPGAMAIVVAKNDAEAKEIAENDPAVEAGVLKAEVKAWNPNAPVVVFNQPKP